MTIKFIFSYARSGGTLLARCIDAMPDTIVLSEVHPIYQINGSIKEQVKKRYHIELLSEGYEANVSELYALCKEKNWQLIIRDWTFIDFTPHAINKFEPSYSFTAYKLLAKQFDLNAISFVRNPIDIWISRNCPKGFFEVYRKYVKKLIDKKISIFKYEEFCEGHQKIMPEICDELNLTFHPSYVQFSGVTNMPGDDGSHPDSRGRQTMTISTFPRRHISQNQLRFLERNQKLIQSNEALNYSSNYHDVPIELTTGLHRFIKKCKSIFVRRPVDAY